jgi:hypothetical protein
MLTNSHDTISQRPWIAFAYNIIPYNPNRYCRKKITSLKIVAPDKVGRQTTNQPTGCLAAGVRSILALSRSDRARHMQPADILISVYDK